jgi:hypothetical protein
LKVPGPDGCALIGSGFVDAVAVGSLLVGSGQIAPQ